jgi:hypothetical protein
MESCWRSARISRCRSARLRNRPSSVDRTGRAIVLMPGPYDSRDKKVNEVKTYDVFGSHKGVLAVRTVRSTVTRRCGCVGGYATSTRSDAVGAQLILTCTRGFHLAVDRRAVLYIGHPVLCPRSPLPLDARCAASVRAGRQHQPLCGDSGLCLIANYDFGSRRRSVLC